MATNSPTGVISFFFRAPISLMQLEQLPAEPYSGLVSVDRPRGLVGVDAFGIRFLILSSPPGYGITPGPGVNFADRRLVRITTICRTLTGELLENQSEPFSTTSGNLFFSDLAPLRVVLEFAPGVTARLWWWLVL